ncbi:MAG: hypothetical protein II936_11500 [Oscillospiraceae bacterium]|nr:hypothetical protein [Oscillospiraceae bacterium]
MALEIERKFLIYKDDVLYEKASEKWDIVQTYLSEKTAGIQRRVRSITINGETHCTYTEKNFIKPMVREEHEREISRDEYERLLTEADGKKTPVVKTRLIIEYEKQHFETDIYPFSDEYCTIELEIAHEDTEIDMPPFVRVIKEVTGDSRYSNAELARTKRLLP